MFEKLKLKHRFQQSSVNRLVVTLHGYGSNMDDLHSFSTELMQFGHVLSLNAPYKIPWGGFAWFDLIFEPNGQVRFKDKNQIRNSIVLLKQEITKALEDLTIPPSELILFGFSQGAMMSYEFIMNVESPIKAACLLSGRQGFSNTSVNQETQVIQTHGVLDEVININDARALKSTLEENFNHFYYKEYSDLGHGISLECWNDVKKELHRITS